MPPAYLLADNAEMADAILALAGHPELARLAGVLQTLRAAPALAEVVLRLADLPDGEREKALAALRGAVG